MKNRDEQKKHGNCMDGITIDLFVESRYQVNRKKIKSAVTQLLIEQGIHGPAELSVAVVGDRKMRGLYKKYKGEDKTTNVLSFPLAEGESTHLPTNVLRLGDVVISYPQIIKEAARDDVMVDEKIEELILHGTRHLLGIHH